MKYFHLYPATMQNHLGGGEGQSLVKRQTKKQEHLFLHGLNFLVMEMFLHQAFLLPVACLCVLPDV